MPAHSVNAPVQDAVGDGDGTPVSAEDLSSAVFEKCLITRRM